MSVLTAAEQMAEPIGFDIARSNDQVQAALLNGLARGMRPMQRIDREMQLAYMTKHLTPDAKALLRDLVGMIEAADG